jgi:DNA-binding transcriptional regulator YiaG
MQVSSASPWPSRAAYAASAVFLAASGSINVTYGWAKGETFASSLTWAAVSAGVAVVFALAWPALIRARSWSEIGVALAALTLAGSYSITAALGSAAGSRYNAATTEQSTTDARKRAQIAYNLAQAEIEKLEPSRSVAELLPLVEAAKPQCRIRVDSTGRQTVCAKPSGLLAELGRAHRRAELQDAVDKASAAGRPMLPEPYHFKGVGLPNVFLLNGVVVEDDAEYGQLVTIHNPNGLYRAIGFHIIAKADAMTGPEFRFLRKHMGHAQASLGERMSVSDQTIANYEKEETAPPQALSHMRLLYLLHVLPSESSIKLLRELSDIAKDCGFTLPELPIRRIAEGWSERHQSRRRSFSPSPERSDYCLVG